MGHSESADIWFAEDLPSRGRNLHTDFNTASVTQDAAQLRRRNVGPNGLVQPMAGSSTNSEVCLVCSGDLGSLDLGSPRATAGSNARWI